MKKQTILGVLCLLHLTTATAQPDTGIDKALVQPRCRIIVDNDFGGDPDGLFLLAQQFLSPTAPVKGIICSHHYHTSKRYPGNVAHAHKMVDELLNVMNIKDVAVYEGTDSSLTNPNKPIETPAAKAIIEEAMRTDNTPLYVVCGAGLTNIASAYLMKPEIAKRITAVVWIGGVEYQDLCRTQVLPLREYNQGIDPIASQVVFNHSDLNIWQIPRDTYRQPLYSYAELKHRIGKAGRTGEYLMSRLDTLLREDGGHLGEAYVLGDSPLVLVTALQTSWDMDAASCEYVVRPTPLINDAGFYDANPDGRPIRIFTKIDSRLLLEDLIAKLNLLDD